MVGTGSAARASTSRGSLPLAEVLPGAETPARTGQDQHARAVAGDAAERVTQLRMHRGIEAVESLGPVQRDARDRSRDVIQDRLVAHRERHSS
jgi:hypothetical protein